MAPKVTLCSTPTSIGLAISALSIHSVILVDCEAQDLGRPGGVLSLISLSDPLAKHVFLIDALAFPSTHHIPSRSRSRSKSKSKAKAPPPTPHPTLAPLLALLSLPRITKVFWDGRADALELHLCYGLALPLPSVLDLQLVDVAARARNSTPGQPAPDLLRGFFKPLRAEVERDPAAYADIYALRGLAHAVGWFQLLPKNKDGDQALKDPAVVAMHESGGSALWLARPLPPALLTYAAHDLALLHAHFTRRAWVRKTMPTLQVQSAAYVGSIGSREENARLGEMDLKRFMPLGILDGEPTEAVVLPVVQCGGAEA
ncbi:hypothetical protein VTO73DRAFT_9843 [Trametes versicolor]